MSRTTTAQINTVLLLGGIRDHAKRLQSTAATIDDLDTLSALDTSASAYIRQVDAAESWIDPAMAFVAVADVQLGAIHGRATQR